MSSRPAKIAFTTENFALIPEQDDDVVEFGHS